MKLFGYQLPGMSSLILWGILWEAFGQLDITFFVPPLSEVVSTLFEIIGTPAFIKALTETAYAFLAGVAAAILIGVPVGVLMGKNRLLDELLLPWVNIFLSAPLTALQTSDRLIATPTSCRRPAASKLRSWSSRQAVKRNEACPSSTAWKRC